jgi:FkbM family methyltransferase
MTAADAATVGNGGDRAATAGGPAAGPPLWLRLGAAVVRRLPVGRYRAFNLLCRRPPPPFATRTPADLGGFEYSCDLRDSISREVFFTGLYEPQETGLVRRLLEPAMTFVDVGANWGFFTLLAAARVGPSGRVVSLEPDPRLFPVLESNVVRNGLSQVTVRRAAAAAEPGELVLDGFDAAGGNFGVSRLAGADASSEPTTGKNGNAPGPSRFRVAAVRLDETLDACGLGAVDLLKMDIEGAECLALRGLGAGLRSGRVRRLLLELHPAGIAALGGTVEATVEPLLAAGFHGWVVDHSAATTRRLAYTRRDAIGDAALATLRPLDVSRLSGAGLDAWPHVLWHAPGVPAPC